MKRQRPWKVSIDGQMLRNKRGAVRTFATGEAAERAARKILLGPL